MNRRLGAAAVLPGVVQWYFLAICWAYISAYSPIAGWLAGSDIFGRALPAILWPLDLLVSIILSLPVAFVVLKLRPSRLWLYLFLAVVPGFLWLNRGTVVSPYFAQFAWLFAPGWVQQLLALPLAAWFLHAVAGPTHPTSVRDFPPAPAA